MTIWSGLIGGLLAVEAARTSGGAPVDWGLFLIAVVGLVLSHAANNMINDYFDTTGGVDTEGYVRALYAPHPILSGWVTKGQLRAAILIVNVIGAAIMLYLAAVRGPLIIVFALAGLFVSVFYVAPPIRLKHHGLGEPGVLIVWGPLMVGGTFLAATGTIPGWVLLGVHPVRAHRHVRAVRQAHRQDRGRHEARRPDPAGHPGRVAGADRRRVADDPVLPADRAPGRRRLGRAVGPARRPWPSRGCVRAQDLRRAQARGPAGLVPERPAGRCGSWASPSSTPAGRAACSRSGSCSNALLPVTLPWL